MDEFVVFISYPELYHNLVIRQGFLERWSQTETIPVVLRSGPKFNEVKQKGCVGSVWPIGNMEVVDVIRTLTSPVVNYSERLGLFDSGINVFPDHDEIGEIAAAHLCELGFDKLAFIDEPNSVFSESRYEGFRRAVKSRGLTQPERFLLTPYESDNPVGFISDLERQFREWLERQPNSIGIFAANDAVAGRFKLAIRNSRYPKTKCIGLLGVDDNASNKAVSEEEAMLTSIRPDWFALGRSVAETFSDVIHRRVRCMGQVRRVPGAVLVRRATILGFTDFDPFVVKITRWLDSEVANGRVPTLPEIAARFNMSHRTLSRKFKNCRNKSIRDFLMDLRIQRASELLRQTDSTISDIAQACGFYKHSDLTEQFRRRMDCTPSAYRKNLPR